MIKEKTQYEFIVAVDPAGIGTTGIVIFDFNNYCLYSKLTFQSKSDIEAVCQFYQLFKNYNKFNSLLIIENFYLTQNQKITHPLSTPKAIGGIKAVAKYILNWDVIEQEPRVKKEISYKGNINFNEHELDAYKHLMYFLQKQS